MGEINDEYDEDEKNYVRINSNTFVFEGKTLLSDFYKILKLDDEIFAEVEGEPKGHIVVGGALMLQQTNLSEDPT